MIGVSDHALLRFLERTGALDVAALREQIAAGLERARQTADRMGSDEYTVVVDGLRYVVKNDVLVTVLTDSMRQRG